MNRTLKEVLWISAVIVIPGMGLFLLAKKIWQDVDEEAEFRKYVHKTYGKGSKFEHEHV